MSRLHTYVDMFIHMSCAGLSGIFKFHHCVELMSGVVYFCCCCCCCCFVGHAFQFYINMYCCYFILFDFLFLFESLQYHTLFVSLRS